MKTTIAQAWMALAETKHVKSLQPSDQYRARVMFYLGYAEALDLVVSLAALPNGTAETVLAKVATEFETFAAEIERTFPL